MNRWKAALGGAALLVTLVANPPAVAANENVVLSDSRFSPREVTIRPGDNVTWRHRDDDTPHSVTFEDGYDPYQGCAEPDLLGSCMEEGDTTQRTFLLPGTFRYYCRIHQGSGMTGVVNVVGGAGSGTSTSTTQQNSGPGATSSSSTTSTTALVVSTSTTRPAIVLSIATTTTAPRPSYQTAPRGGAPSLNREAPSNEDQFAALPSGTDAGAGDVSGGGGGAEDGSVAPVVAAVVALAGGAGVLAWRFRPPGRIA